jgi:hypothetical protein
LDANQVTGDPKRYGYCKLYIRDDDRERVLELIGRLPGAVVAESSAVVDGITFDVRRNEDANPSEAHDFVYWPVIVDITTPAPDPSEIVDRIGELLRAAWAADIPAVAACPFEDELPWSGGIERITV